jgi:hypothetical protein
VSDCIEYRTTNGHTVLMDSEDWDNIRPLLEGGVRLQSIAELGGLKVILREYASGNEPARTMLLAKVIMRATEFQYVKMSNGLLDHRKQFLELVTESRRSGWASRIHATQRNLNPT